MMNGQVREGNANACVRPRYDREECRKLSLRKDLWEGANLEQWRSYSTHVLPDMSVVRMEEKVAGCQPG